MITTRNDKFHLVTARYNNVTHKELVEYKKKRNIDGCLFNVPREMPEGVMREGKVFVFEMNNDRNQIMGIGYLLNRIRYDKYYKVHSDMNYNRCSYVGKYHVSREKILECEEHKDVLEIIENIVFRGKNHIKRGQGFISIPEKKMKEHKMRILRMLIELFIYERNFDD
jgi:hypothetical protein